MTLHLAGVAVAEWVTLHLAGVAVAEWVTLHLPRPPHHHRQARAWAAAWALAVACLAVGAAERRTALCGERGGGSGVRGGGI